MRARRVGSQLSIANEATNRSLKILLYAEVDLNLIDGSAIWLASVAELLAGIERVELQILQRTVITRDVVVSKVASLPNVTLIDPWQLARDDAEAAERLAEQRSPRLDSATAADLIRLLQHRAGHDVVMVRGEAVADALCADPELRSRLWCYMANPRPTQDASVTDRLQRICAGARRLLCQTEQAEDALLEAVDGVAAAPVTLLPPMVPGPLGPPRSLQRTLAPRLVYSGKFSPGYRVLETLAAFQTLRSHLPDAELHVVGDKFHNAPPVDGFVEVVTARLKSDPGVVWHGGVTRERNQELLQDADIACSWRTSSFDDSVEMSTKVLEYAAAGLPVLMNPSTVQRATFGPDYPLYVTSEDEFVSSVLLLTATPPLYSTLSAQLTALAERYLIAEVRKRISESLANDVNLLRQRRNSATQ